MRIDILTVFPEMISAALDHSIIKRAIERELIDIRVVNLRDFTSDRHHTTDDVPYGGGGGMVMKIEPIALALGTIAFGDARPRPESNGEWEGKSGVSTTLSVEEAIDRLKSNRATRKVRIALTDPRGAVFTQETARIWAKEEHLILLCGHYEGVDDRVRQFLTTDEVSIGDYILTGGELPALIIADALTRLQNGALGDAEATGKDTFSNHLLEHPHYTRPKEFFGMSVPEVLLSGHHAQIENWRRWHQLTATRERRPDLYARIPLSSDDYKLLSGSEPAAPPDPKAIRRAAYIADEVKKADLPSPDENLLSDHEMGTLQIPESGQEEKNGARL